MYTAIIDEKTIKAQTLPALKRLASIEANKKYRVCDVFYLTNTDSPPLLFMRRNAKTPNNTIKRGQWQ